MPRQNRAKIFAPYDALKGFEETVHAKDEVYARRVELSEYAQERLDQKLRQLQRGSRVTITWFQPKQNSGDLGEYFTVEGIVMGIDMVCHRLLIGTQAIWIPDITGIEG